jgi:NADH-quinone oxidoreductase subunit A
MEYGTVLTFIVFSLFFVAMGVIVNYLLMPTRPDNYNHTTYECGIDPLGDARIKYSLRFYAFALVYLIFAVEGSFMFPISIIYNNIDGIGIFFDIFLFVLIIVLGLIFAMVKGELEWD